MVKPFSIIFQFYWAFLNTNLIKRFVNIQHCNDLLCMSWARKCQTQRKRIISRLSSLYLCCLRADWSEFLTLLYSWQYLLLMLGTKITEFNFSQQRHFAVICGNVSRTFAERFFIQGYAVAKTGASWLQIIWDKPDVNFELFKQLAVSNVAHRTNC